MRDKSLLRGFTLLELLVVIIILGILAALAIPKFMAGQESARVAEAVRALGAVREAQEAYHDITGRYAQYIGNLDPKIHGPSFTSKAFISLKYWRIYVMYWSPYYDPTGQSYNIFAYRMPVADPGSKYRWKYIAINENGVYKKIMGYRPHPMTPKND